MRFASFQNAGLCELHNGRVSWLLLVTTLRLVGKTVFGPLVIGEDAEHAVRDVCLVVLASFT